MRRAPDPSRSGFSLIELLAVMAIIILLASLAVPAFNQISRASTISTAGQTLVDTLNLARQTALTRNRKVEVRFYQLESDFDPEEKAVRAMQLFVVEPTGLRPITRVINFPKPVIMSDSKGGLPTVSTTSTILNSQSDTTNKWDLPKIGSSYDYASFYFKPTGSTDLDPNQNNWLATLIIPTEPLASNSLPPNYVTVRIDALSGKVTVFRP